MAIKKSYPILEIINSIESILLNEPDIVNRLINANTVTPQTVALKVYKIVSLEMISLFLCPAISIFSYFNPKFDDDSSAAEKIDPEIFIDVCCENYDLIQAIKDSYMLAEDIHQVIKQNKGLKGNVASCVVKEIEELGSKFCDNDLFKFGFRIHLKIKTR